MISNVFLDEIDSISCIRGSESSIADQRLTNQLLIERDNINNSQLAVFVIAATNLPWQIDDAVTRRLSRNICIKKIYVYQKYMYTNARSYCYTYFIHIFRERRLVNASSQRNICIPMPDHAARSSMFSAAKCVAVCCSVLQCVAVCCSVLQCVAVCCSVLQCVAVCCSARSSMFSAAFSDICSPDEIEVFSQQTDNFLGSDISNINNRVKFMPLHILYICKKIVVSILSGEKSSICVCADPHNTSLGTILEIDFHGVVREYGEHAINIPAIYAVFISDQISFCSPTVSTSSREKYISYSESLFK